MRRDDIDWNGFAASADHDGSVDVEHVEDGCYWSEYVGGSTTIADAMKLAEEHLKTCPIWIGERS